MKRFLNFMAALALVAGSFMLAGCDAAEELADELTGPENTWCELPVYVTASKANGDDPDLYLEFIYVPEDYTGTTGSTNLDKDITLEAGITVLAHASVDITSLGMSAGSYTMKTFAINATDNDSDDNDSYTFAGTKAKWTAIYWAKEELRDTSTQIVLPKAPAPVCNGTGYTALSDFSKFNWKTLLTTYLLNSLE